MHMRKYLFASHNLDSYGLQKPFPHFICVRVCEQEKAMKEFWIQNENFKIILFSLQHILEWLHYCKEWCSTTKEAQGGKE